MRALQNKRSIHGFSLLELLAVVAIIGILASIAYPMYQEQVVKSRRAAGAACLQERAQFMERYYTTNMTYVGAPNPPACSAEVSPYYRVQFNGTPGAKAFRLEAVPQGVQATKDTKCGTLSLTAQGVRGESGTASSAAECW